MARFPNSNAQPQQRRKKSLNKKAIKALSLAEPAEYAEYTNPHAKGVEGLPDEQPYP